MTDNSKFQGRTEQAIQGLQSDVTEIKSTLANQNKTLMVLIVLTTVAMIEKLPQLVSLVLAK